MSILMFCAVWLGLALLAAGFNYCASKVSNG
jgi:hypothetical protein